MSDENETPETENDLMPETESPDTGFEPTGTTEPDNARKHTYYADERITLADIQKHISGPLISIILHIIILIVLGTAVMFDPPVKNEKEEVVVEMKNMEVEPPPPEPPPPPPAEEVITDATFDDIPLERPTMKQTDTVMNNVAEPVTAVGTADASFDDMSVPSEVPVVESSKSALKLSGAFAARSGSGRKLAIKKYGGSAQTERAVERALDWLVSVQNEDGSWGDYEDEYYHKVQLTCYALLAFLAHGETPQSEKYGEALMKGLKRVLVWEETRKVEAGTDENGKPKWQWLNDTWNRLDSVARIGIVLAEGYAITKIPALERGMNRIIDTIIKTQNPEGGFHRHKDRDGNWVNRFDLYNGSFAYNALYSAYNAGCELPGMEESIKRSINAIEKKHFVKKAGGFTQYAVNDKGEGRVGFNETAEATLFLYLMGSNGREAQKGYEWLTKFKPNNKDNSEMRMDWKNLPSQTSAVGWYYMTQAIFQATSGTGKEWNRWNTSVCRTLIREQNSAGYWECPADKYEHFEEKMITLQNGRQKLDKVQKIYNESEQGGWTPENAKLWATTFFTLTLEVYYRYLPTFEADGTKAALEIQKISQDGASEEVDATVSDDDISLD